MNDLFAKEHSKHFPMQLPHHIIGRLVPLETYFAVEEALEPHVFLAHVNVQRHFSTPSGRRTAQSRLSQLQQQGHQEAIVFYDADRPIGWSAGRMENANEFLMDVTGLLPAYQSKGIYSAFLRLYLPYLRDLGYERVLSYHSPSNRAVLIAKLKAGFVIRATVFRENAGASVQLVYFLHEDRLTAFEEVHSLQPSLT